MRREVRSPSSNSPKGGPWYAFEDQGYAPCQHQRCTETQTETLHNQRPPLWTNPAECRASTCLRSQVSTGNVEEAEWVPTDYLVFLPPVASETPVEAPELGVAHSATKPDPERVGRTRPIHLSVMGFVVGREGSHTSVSHNFVSGCVGERDGPRVLAK